MTAHKSFKAFTPTSKASKPRHKNWDRKTRFMEGHDAGCRGLLPEHLHLQNLTFVKKPKAKTRGVYRSHSFDYTREERIVEDALFLINRGYAWDIEEALARAIKNHPEPEYSNRG